MLHTRLSSEGAIQPLPLLPRLSKRGFLYRVWRCRLPRRTPRLLSRLFLIASPRWASSAANTTSPLALLTIAMPVVLLPGSILMRSDSTCGCSTAFLRMIVNGYLLNTAAFLAVSSIRALPGCTGLSCCLFVSSTKTFDMCCSLCSYEPPLTQVMLALTMLWSGLA